MEYVALYRKYRPKCLDDVYGQKYIVDIVKNSVLNDRFFHAYLFSGPRGTGKTTVAKLIAKLVNCSSLDSYNVCDSCESCLMFNDGSNPDVIEIDAASNNGVEEIRAIRDKVVLMPAVSKYKVYIIDEVHMLSTSAFNALLKTLEEPPKHVIFILATTEMDKVPETIISRCQCYDFRRIGESDIALCLKSICDKEGFDVSADVLNLIAGHCNGGMRDSIGLLDKLVSYSSVVDTNLFYDVVGLVNEDLIFDICFNISNGNITDVFDTVEKMVKSGKKIDLLVSQMLSFLKNCYFDKRLNVSDEVIVKMLSELSDIYYQLRFSVNQMLCFEVGIVKLVNELKSTQIIYREIISDIDSSDESSSDVVNKREKEEKSEQMVDNNDLDVKASCFDVVINNAFALADKELKKDIVNKWRSFSDYVHNKEFAAVVSYFLDSSLQVVGEKDVIISANYESIVNNASKNIAKLELLFNLVMGKSYNLAFVLDSEWELLKDKYISDMKLGKKYNYIEPTAEKSDIIVDKTVDSPRILQDAVDMFGDDIVEIK